MKQFNLFTIISFVLLVTLSGLFTACDDDDAAGGLKLDRAAIQIKEGSEGILKVESGSGGYQFSFSTEGIATAKFRENLIYIQALKYGKVTMNITDDAGHSATLDIIIISSVLNTDTPRFVWGKRIELEKTNNWGVTAHENRVAVTNVVEQTQYLLSWDGDSSVGAKTNATLKLMEKGTEPQTIELAGLEIIQVKDGLYSMIFSTTERTGELVFSK